MIKYKEPKLQLREGEFNDFDLMLFHNIIVFDHLRQKTFIIANITRDNLEENFIRAKTALAFIESLIHSQEPPASSFCKQQVEFTCNVEKHEYAQLVDRTREYIREGDIFQAVISRRFTAVMKGGLLNAYRILRTTNPSPYMVYLKTDDVELMCSSPETLVRLREDNLVTFPIAGSRPRGKTKKEDTLLEKELLEDEKELSEHNMLVDLGRNDLGMISKFDSVKVTQYMKIHRYSKIMHICSQWKVPFYQVLMHFMPSRRYCLRGRYLVHLKYGPARSLRNWKQNLGVYTAVRWAILISQEIWIPVSPSGWQ